MIILRLDLIYQSFLIPLSVLPIRIGLLRDYEQSDQRKHANFYATTHIYPADFFIPLVRSGEAGNRSKPHKRQYNI